MSWMKRPEGAPGATPEGASYAPQYQESGNQQAMYQNYPGAAPPNTGAVTQQYWQMPYSPNYQQPEYVQNNSNQLYQCNPGQAAGYQHAYYRTQQTPQQGYPKQKQDGWEDNWDWGWEERQHAAQQNANVIEESFTNNDSWNWTAEDAASTPAETHTQAAENEPLVRTLSDRDTVRERFPNLALGKRLNADLTPQWSIESQMSQDSTDDTGAHTHSESTYRSENQSRNSNKSSDEHEWAKHTSRAGTLRDDADISHEELTNTLRELNIVNIENPVPEAEAAAMATAGTLPFPISNLSSSTSVVTPTASAASPALPTADINLITASNHLHPNVSAPVNLPTPPSTDPSRSSPSMLPQTLPPSSTQNSFKHSAAFSHKPKSHSPNGAGACPASANKMNQHRSPIGYPTANLETAPDNSERPDHPQSLVPFHLLPPQPTPENLEIAPRNDRNEYLQTGHLSTSHYNENTDFNRNAPPPGLRRMVVGQQEAGGYAQNLTSEEPPPGLSRMVPGQQTESAGDAYMDRRIDGQPTDIRNPYRQADGQQTTDNFRPSRNAYNEQRVVTGVDAAECNAPDIDQRREVTMEGENLEDLSERHQSSTDVSHPRTQALDGALQSAIDNPVGKADMPDSLELPPNSSRRQSLNRMNTSGEESERDRVFKSSPRRERGYATKYEGERRRDERRDKESRRRDREGSPGERRHRRADRRYETEDTDYYSDRERDRRRYREGSYTSKPPRPDDKERRHRDDRDRSRRYNTIERDGSRRGERRYRDIDPTRKYGNHEDRRRGEEPLASEWSAEGGERRRRRRHHDHYYENYGGYNEAYLMQRQQYQYYEHLRLTNPTAYLEIYNKIMAGQTPPGIPNDPTRVAPLYADGLSSLAGEDRGSVHSGRSSINNNTGRFYSYDTTPVKYKDNADLSERDFTTDASLNLHLEESTDRSERMTPFKYSTAHVKGVISSQNIVLVRPSYPVDGLPATVEILDLCSAREADDDCAEIDRYPGPLIKGVTHKQSVVEYCIDRSASAKNKPVDPLGASLIWELLALMLRQNGVVLGADVAELLVKSRHELSDLQSSLSPAARDTPSSAESALEQYRRYLMVGNTQQALECAMSNGLWGHALSLSLWDRRVRSMVLSRFMSSLAPTDPLLTLYTNAAHRQPAAAKAVGDEKWGDWRPHLAILLANPSAKPDVDRKTIVQMGDSLRSRGLPHSAQFCYLAAEVEFAAPRPPLLLWDGEGGTPNEAIFATDIYEYARGLHQHYVLPSLQEYKLLLAGKLCDCGQYAKALALVEALAEVLTSDPGLYPRRLLTQTAKLADRLQYHEPSAADEEEGDSSESAPNSPRGRHWIERLRQAVDARLQEPAQACGWIQEQPLQNTFEVDDGPQYHTTEHHIETQTSHPLAYNYGSEWSGHQQLEPEPAPAQDEPLAGQYWNNEREESAPSISLPGATSTNRPALYDEPEGDMCDSAANANRPKEEAKKEERPGGSNGGNRGGWFGGIFTKLSLKPPNQMILPDDKNPSIVWDSENKRWKNVDGDDDTSVPPPPPPIATPPAAANAANAAPLSNIFKMQKGRHIKKSYVDVFNQPGVSRPLPPAEQVFGPSVPAFGNTSYFVPGE